MRDATDVFTGDLLGKRGRGRPRKPDAMSGAQRAKAYRDRKAGVAVRPQASPVRAPSMVQPRAERISPRNAFLRAEAVFQSAWGELAACHGAVPRLRAAQLVDACERALGDALVEAQGDVCDIAKLDGSLFRFRRALGPV